jgi:hypothetical protein
MEIFKIIKSDNLPGNVAEESVSVTGSESGRSNGKF